MIIFLEPGISDEQREDVVSVGGMRSRGRQLTPNIFEEMRKHFETLLCAMGRGLQASESLNQEETG